jgi:hypothetical protein
MADRSVDRLKKVKGPSLRSSMTTFSASTHCADHNKIVILSAAKDP